jgi:hypothetical protein
MVWILSISCTVLQSIYFLQPDLIVTGQTMSITMSRYSPRHLIRARGSIICSEQGQTIRKIWDGSQLSLTFRRNVNQKLMNCWYELEGLASCICYVDD